MSYLEYTYFCSNILSSVSFEFVYCLMKKLWFLEIKHIKLTRKFLSILTYCNQRNKSFKKSITGKFKHKTIDKEKTRKNNLQDTRNVELKRKKRKYVINSS